MGLDYTYILVIPKNKRENLVTYISENGSFHQDHIVIYCEIDSFVLKYLEGGYDFFPHYNREEMNQFILPNNLARIGGFDFHEEFSVKDNKEFLIVRFTAVTTDMSKLIEDSVSIRKWFIDLSREVNSVITYLDLEYEGHRIVYYRGEEVCIELKGEGFIKVGKEKFLDIMKEFAEYLRHFR